MTADPAVNGYIGAGYYGDPAQYTQQQYTQQQQYNQQQYSQQQQFNQQQYNMQQQYNYEDYTHYPNPEDYLSERSRAYFPAGAEHYAMPSKQIHSRNRLDSDCK